LAVLFLRLVSLSAVRRSSPIDVCDGEDDGEP
jgi:hypothetical protein